MSPSLKKVLAVVGVSAAVLLVSGVLFGGHDKELAAKADSFNMPDDRLESPLFADANDPVLADAGSVGAQPMTDGGSRPQLSGSGAAKDPGPRKAAGKSKQLGHKKHAGKAGKHAKAKKTSRHVAKKHAGKAGKSTAHRKAKAKADQTASSPV